MEIELVVCFHQLFKSYELIRPDHPERPLTSTRTDQEVDQEWERRRDSRNTRTQNMPDSVPPRPAGKPDNRQHEYCSFLDDGGDSDQQHRSRGMIRPASVPDLVFNGQQQKYQRQGLEIGAGEVVSHVELKEQCGRDRGDGPVGPAFDNQRPQHQQPGQDPRCVCQTRRIQQGVPAVILRDVEEGCRNEPTGTGVSHEELRHSFGE